MQHELHERRTKIKALLESSEKDLLEARNSAALGGHSRAILLDLERKLRDGRKDLASIELELQEAKRGAEKPV